ncbi:hypothetical protein LTR99_010796 [Exophiala xenobiotica]|uniref:Uncharacterized protein n=1 Tax=Vermiconidia calcicola TaxID=1690605 RepID=A0AAV9PR92_9PEZI|nr:hypothetical protein H2202_010053 [Exophiala xenobiotica]KAK5527890.1 hypothetical protein LTR25_010821 [Vermiconidia calcicola]KAK5538200.1 hypothetical protein LTR23_007164 [Chaetothyriales sp. CCFEE 6169]KAK5189497.1 hypothetical protein LTR92_010550 [Exophiala xenobiotica]KAK5234243.1 hypothetical protein LTR47_004834 [Exophiala xenobiotica]
MLSTIFVLISLVVRLRVCALEVASGSSCADICEGPGLTFPSDLTCNDEGYFNTAKGDTMHDCLVCESTSTHDTGDTSTPQNNDIYWFLFNMKYTLQYCMFQTNDSTPNLPQCESDCAGLYPVLQSSWFSPTAAQQYDYCSINNTAFPQYADQCASCLQAGTGSVILGNFLSAMKSGCDTQPNATEGQTIALQRDIFDTATVATGTATQTTSTSAAQTSGGTQSTATTTTSSSSSGTTSSSATTSSTIPAGAPEPTSSSSGLSGGAAAGIGIGCGLASIGAVGALAWFILRRRRNRRTMASRSDYVDTKAAYAATPYQQMPSPNDPYAQQIGGSEVHEIDSSGTKGGAPMTNELDGRPMR